MAEVQPKSGTELLYYKDPYIHEVQAKILKINTDEGILLDKTIFFPGSSTEEADGGTIDNVPVYQVRKNNGRIYHILQNNEDYAQFRENQMVKIQINWNKRYKKMKIHTTLHLVAYVLDKAGCRPAAGIVSATQGEMVMRSHVDKKIIENAITQCNKLIEQGLNVRTFWDKEKKGFRWCEIDGFAPLPCGGLHVKNIKEIGKIKIIEIDDKGRKTKILLTVE